MCEWPHFAEDGKAPILRLTALPTQGPPIVAVQLYVEAEEVLDNALLIAVTSGRFPVFGHTPSVRRCARKAAVTAMNVPHDRSYVTLELSAVSLPPFTVAQWGLSSAKSLKAYGRVVYTQTLSLTEKHLLQAAIKTLTLPAEYSTIIA